MTDAEKYVKVFRAAAQGVMRPYPPPQMAPGSSGVGILKTHDEASYNHNHARSIAGAFNAIADVFQDIVDAESEE